MKDDLFEKSIVTLELPRVLELLSHEAVTEEGKERCLALRPFTDPDDVERALSETSAAVDLVSLRGAPYFGSVRPVRAALQRADMGGSLNTRELLDIAAVLRCARGCIEYAADSDKKTPMDPLFNGLSAHRSLEEEISGSILSEEEIADAASPELADIRRKKRATAAKVRDILQKLISSNQSKYLHHHPEKRPVCGAGEVGAQERRARPGPRPLGQRRHLLHRAHGGGEGQQRAS